MTTTPNGVGRTGDVKDADSKLNFGDGGWLEDTVWSQPSGGRPKGEGLVSIKSISNDASVMHEELEVPMLIGLCNVIRTVLLGNKIAATVGI